MSFFKIGNEEFDVDEENSFIAESTEDYRTSWDIMIETKKNSENHFVNIRGDKVIIPENCLKEWSGKTVSTDNYFFCEDENSPFSVYNYEHCDTCLNSIEFGEITGDVIKIKWTGSLDLYFGERIEENDSFEISCNLKIKSMISPGQFVSPSIQIIKVINRFESLNHEEKEKELWGLEDILDTDNIYIKESSIKELEVFLKKRLEDHDDDLNREYDNLLDLIENIRGE